MSIELLSLKAKIKGLSQELTRLRKRKHEAPVKYKSMIEEERRRLGQLTRHIYLAYAFAKGKKFRDIELTGSKNNRPDPNWISKILFAESRYSLNMIWLYAKQRFVYCTDTDISRWLSEEKGEK